MALLAVIALAVIAVGGFRVYRHFFPPAPPPAAQVIQETASAARAMTSANATFTTQVSGITVMFGTVRERVSPTRLARLTMTSVDGTDRFAVSEVVTLADVYVSMPTLTAAFGKPWLEVPVPQLGADPVMMGLYQTAALPTAEAALVGTASTAQLAGSTTIRGARVSRYTGGIDPVTAAAALPPELQQLLAPELAATTGTISFTAWIDAQHDLRKVQTTAIIAGRRTVTTVVVTAVNRKMHIVVPRSAEVASLHA